MPSLGLGPGDHEYSNELEALPAPPLLLYRRGSQLDIDTRLALADSVTEWKLWSTFFWKAAKEQIKIPPIPVGFCVWIAVDTMKHAPDALDNVPSRGQSKAALQGTKETRDLINRAIVPFGGTIAVAVVGSRSAPGATRSPRRERSRRSPSIRGKRSNRA